MVGPLGFEPRTSGSAEGLMRKTSIFLNKQSNRTVPSDARVGEILKDFAIFCQVDLRLSKKSIGQHTCNMRKILASCGLQPSAAHIRAFLAGVENPYTYNNFLKSLRVFFRDFRGSIEPVRTFRFARVDFTPARLYTRPELQRFHSELDDARERALFLLYATSGRRRCEILDLQMGEIDVDARVIQPNKMSSTKRTWYSFFNAECQGALREYLQGRRDPKRSGRLFPMRSSDRSCIFSLAQAKSGLHITPQDLRFWFANEMSRLGVADRFIDAFQGRVPRSVLARHYTDYSMEHLKEIYDKAGLKIINNSLA